MTLRRVFKTTAKNALGFKGTKRVTVLGGPARGVEMTLDFSGHTPLYLGLYELELHRWLRHVLPQVRLVFDVGGDIGYYALMFAAKTSARVVTLEPDTSQADLLQANISQNPTLNPRITLQRLAVGVTVDGDTTTLDSLTDRYGTPDMIKIDIEGGELDALRGGIDTITARRPHIVIETHSPELERECGTFLIERGYRPIIKHNRSVWRELRGGASHCRWLLATGNA